MSLTDPEIEALTDEQLEDTLERMQRAKGRRFQVKRAAESLDTANAAVLESVGQVSGGAWVDPVDSLHAFPRGWITTHAGKTWISKIPGNREEPGTGNAWAEVVTSMYPAWAADTAYASGATVTHGGMAWMSLVANNMTEPGPSTSGTYWIAVIEEPM